MKNNQPLVSYVVACYNHEKYIRSAIFSILGQTYKNIELIVVDDGSTDGSAEILLAIQKEHPFNLILQRNSGVVAAINRGIAETSGEYVVPHASDDVSELNRTELQLRSFRDENVGFVVGGIRKISESGIVLTEWSPGDYKTYVFDDFLAGRASVSAVACMYRGKPIRELLPLDVALPFEDVQMHWGITNAGYSCFVDPSNCIVNYRILENSLGRTNKVGLYLAFLRFIYKYKDHPHFEIALARGKSGVFYQMAEESSTLAIKYYLTHYKYIPLSIALKGIFKMVIPRMILSRIRNKY